VMKELPEWVRDRTIVVNADKGTAANRTSKRLTTWSVKRTRDGNVDLVSLLKKAGKEGVSSLLVDGGRELSTAFLKRNLVDRVWYFISPEMLARGDEPFGDLGIRKISQCKIVKNCEFKQSKDGILAVGYLTQVGTRQAAPQP
jgi:riboflavin biosynthesis pyrimidine reductase